ncbi:MAG: hypothetical protein KF729_17260 [Sandaracinaceae bacterium]|nr:hypothetical protein [Sandaracinaceae bacterium]
MRTVPLAIVLALLPAAASAQRATYRGAHPVDHEGGWHHAEEEHEHDTLLVGHDPFGDVDGVRVFLGDPLAYGWAEAVWSFRGAHPLPGLDAYCGVTGDHRHAFPPEGTYRRTSSGVYVYTGGLRGGLPMARPARVSPRAPVTPPPVAVAAPWWAWGCEYHLLPGSGGSFVPALRSAACVPGVRRAWGAGGAPVEATPGAGAGPAPGSYFDGRYGGFRAPPVQGGRPARPSQ